jgi:hypothetical protein
VAADATTHRSDVPDRRARLRRLDIPLGSEFEDGGAMTFAELRRHVATRNLLGVPVSDATLWEWWSYACRRRFIERDEGTLYRLSPDARRDIATRRAEESLKVTPTVRALVRNATPAGWLSLVIASAALASTNPTALAAVGALLVGLALAGCIAITVDLALGERADARLDRRVLSRHVAWLDGGPLPRLFWMRAQPAVLAASMRPRDAAAPGDRRLTATPQRAPGCIAAAIERRVRSYGQEGSPALRSTQCCSYSTVADTGGSFVYVPFRLDEYDEAFARFMSDAILALATAGSPLLSKMAPMETVPGAVGSSFQAPDGETVDLPASSLSASHTMSIDAVRSCDDGVLMAELVATAEEFTEELERGLISTLQTVTAATGNSTDASGRNNIDALIDGLDKLEMSMDDDGELNLPTLVVNPADVDAFGRPTPEQQLRISQVLDRKKAELVARRRSRRIPRRR